MNFQQLLLGIACTLLCILGLLSGNHDLFICIKQRSLCPLQLHTPLMGSTDFEAPDHDGDQDCHKQQYKKGYPDCSTQDCGFNWRIMARGDQCELAFFDI